MKFICLWKEFTDIIPCLTVVKLTIFIFIDGQIFTQELWLLRVVGILEFILLIVMVIVISIQHRKLSGLVLIDLHRGRNARRRRRNIQTTHL